ncbi:MAG: hypothetical protein KIH69_017500 [Anaerolineae bacterium]|nr:hypothetical protein [Anaerolineae bacterium]
MLLIITHENIGERMAGPSIRSWEIAKALGKHGAQVRIITPYDSHRSAPNVEIVTFDWAQPDSIAQHIEAASAVMGIGTVLARVIALLGKPIVKPTIVDTYYVPEIEQILLNITTHKREFDPTPIFVNEMSTYLRQADFLLVATEHQYDFWLGGLLANGRLNSATLDRFHVDNLIGMVPLGIPDEEAGEPRAKNQEPRTKSQEPSNENLGLKAQDSGLRTQDLGLRTRDSIPIAGLSPSDKIVYWGGGIWDWTDPLTLLDAMREVWQTHSDAKLVFGALHHYDQRIVPQMSVAGKLIAQVKVEGLLGKQVFFGDWLPYDERGAFLMQADVGVGLTLRTIENRYAVRARILDYVWTGLPCVLSAGDEYADWAAHIGLAKLVQPGDAPALAQAILAQLNDPTSRTERIAQLRPVIAHRRWSAVVQPLLHFIRQPALAADADAARASIGGLVSLRSEIDTLRRDRDALGMKAFEWESAYHQLNLDLNTQLNQVKTDFDGFKQRPFIKLGDKIGNTVWMLRNKLLGNKA